MTQVENQKRNVKILADAKKRYAKGESIRTIADATGQSYGKIHRMLTEDGVTMRPRGGSRPGPKKAKGKK